MTPEPLPAWPWHRVPAAVAESVENRLFSELKTGPLFVLVDRPVGEPDIEMFDGMPRFALDAQLLRLPPLMVPYLVQVESRHVPVLARTIEAALREQLFFYHHGQGALRIGGWLQHKQDDGAALAGVLSRLFRLERPLFGVPSLRLADRRVLEILHRASRQSRPALLPLVDWPSQLGQDIACWIYLDGNMQIRAMRGKPGVQSGGPLRLPKSYWQLLARSAQLNEILARWHYRTHPLPEDALGQALFWLRRSEREMPAWTTRQHVEHIVARLAVPALPMARL